MCMTSRGTWKELERRIARMFKKLDETARRVPLSGLAHFETGADVYVENIPLFIDVKMRKRFLHHTLFRQVREKAKRENRIPILVTHEKGKKKDYIIVMSLYDFIDLMSSKEECPPM